MQRSYKRTTALQYLIIVVLLLFTSNLLEGQLTLSVTIDQGTATTTCTDIFGAPDPLWRVNIEGSGWTTYSNNNANGCHATYPNEQLSVTVDCLEDLPSTIEVCFRAFENDGFGCNLGETCVVEDCDDLVIPGIGLSSSFNIDLPTGLNSGGDVDVTIALTGTSVASNNDEICDATDLGILPNNGILGDASSGGFNNICSSNTNDVNPMDDGEWNNEQGVWVQFTTSATPGYELLIEALNDPTNLGNTINLQMALYVSNDGTCTGNLSLLESAYTIGDFDESILLKCPKPNTTYFVLVDGNSFNDELEGFFGIQVSDTGGEMAPEQRCDALDMGMVPIGGNVSVTNQSNHCANNIGDPNPSAFISQKSVWYYFQAPPSGHVIIDAVSDLNEQIGLQLGLYRSFNNMCNGFFFEVESSFTSQNLDENIDVQCLNPGENYWVLIDGSGSATEGIFDLTIHDGGIYPPMETNDTTICFGTSMSVGTATYDETDTYTFVFQLSSGCDSTVITNLTIADSLAAIASTIQVASSMTSADGVVTVNAIGGVAPYTYLWDTGATTQTVSGLSPNTYCVTVTDDLGCVAEGCVLLEFSTMVVTAFGSELLCNGDSDGTISFSVADGVAPYNYTYTDIFLMTNGSGVLTADNEVVTIDDLSEGTYQIFIEDAIGTTTFTSAQVTEPAEITYTLDSIICFGDSIQVGNTIYNSSGNINETLVASNGCDSIVTGTLTVLPDPSFDINAVLCAGGSVVIGSSIYNQDGIYQDTFLTTTGCDSIVTTNVLVLDEITVEINATMLPTGYSFNDGEATADATGGAGGYTFVWSTLVNTQDILNVTGGQEYCVTVTDANGCTAETCKTILYESNIASANANPLVCNNVADGVIDLTVQNGLGDYNYFWENTTTGDGFNGIIEGNSGTDQITGLDAGNYSITVSDAFVSTIITLEITEPAPLNALVVFPTSNLCSGDCSAAINVEVLGGTEPYDFIWSGGLDPVSNPSEVCAGSYQLTITDNNGCTLMITWDVDDGVDFSSTVSEVESISCVGESNGILSAQGTGGFGSFYSYEWSDGSTDSIANNLTAGTYTVTIYDGVGCTTTSSMILSEPAAINFDLVIEDVNCWDGENSGSISIENVTGGNPPYVYSIGGGAFSSNPINAQLLAGSYQVIVQDAMGCEESINAFVNFPDALNLTIGDNQLINLGETVTLDVLHSSNNPLITWELDSCQNCPTLELQPLETANYSVTVQDTITGCSETASIWINVSKERIIFIPNAFSPNEDGNNDIFMVFGNEKSIANIHQLTIFDRWGATLYEGTDLVPNNQTAGWDGFFNGQKIKAGVYIYFIEIEFIDGRTEIFKGDVTLMN